MPPRIPLRLRKDERFDVNDRIRFARYDDVAEALIKGGADPALTNGDGLTASMVEGS